MKQKARTFVAVDIGSAVRGRTAELIEALKAAGADAKWVDPKNLHVTLKFLGDVDTREIHHVCRAVQDAVVGVAPFEFELRGVGAFPGANRPRTVWLGVAQGEKQLVALHQQIEPPLEKLGFRKEARRYHPHLTIGRIRRGGPGVLELGTLIGQHADFEAGQTAVSEVIVFSSHFDRSGPTYEPLAQAPLASG